MTSFILSDLLSWQLEGACLDERELFSRPELDGTGRKLPPKLKASVSKAREICMSCPVREICLETAMHDERYDNLNGRTGMRGGYTARERMQAERDKKRCSRCLTPNNTKPQGLNHYRVTCSTCSTIINRDLDERYFGTTVDNSLQQV